MNRSSKKGDRNKVGERLRERDIEKIILFIHKKFTYTYTYMNLQLIEILGITV